MFPPSLTLDATVASKPPDEPGSVSLNRLSSADVSFDCTRTNDRAEMRNRFSRKKSNNKHVTGKG